MVEELERKKAELEQRPCHICRERDYEWGTIAEAQYITNTAMSSRRLIARRCLNCGNVQTFAGEVWNQQTFREGCLVPLLITGFVLALVIALFAISGMI